MPTMTNMTRAQRRRAYSQIRAELAGAAPADTVANLLKALESLTPAARRPCDAEDAGVWLPSFTLAAFAASLRDAQRGLRRQGAA